MTPEQIQNNVDFLMLQKLRLRLQDKFVDYANTLSRRNPRQLQRLLVQAGRLSKHLDKTRARLASESREPLPREPVEEMLQNWNLPTQSPL